LQFVQMVIIGILLAHPLSVPIIISVNDFED
jgi:hypothetical protein